MTDKGEYVVELDMLISTAEIIQKLNPLDVSIMISNAEGILVKYVSPKTFDLNVKVGDKIPAGSALEECLHTNKEIDMKLPADLFGTPIRAIALPIQENGKLLGGIALGINLATQRTLQESSQVIAATSEQITAATEELAATATTLAQNLAGIKTSSETVMQELQKTTDILKFVNDVASNSNLLGLNAAIEAARAGEQGRGFAVVAEEIRKMAVDSAQAVKDIKKNLTTIHTETSGMVTSINDTASLGDRQAAASQEISASIQHLASSAADIEKVAEIL